MSERLYHGGGLTEELMTLGRLVDAAPGYAATRIGTLPVEDHGRSGAGADDPAGASGSGRGAGRLVLHHPGSPR